MPTYEYRCTKCGHSFEQFQSIKDASLRTCPACKTRNLERLIGIGAAVLFKGSGFFQTDYRSESYKKGQEADSPATPAKPDANTNNTPETKAQTKAETKPEPKSEAKPAKPEASAKASKNSTDKPRRAKA